MNFFERFDLLAKQKGSSVNAVAKELGIASGTVTAWKQGSEATQSKIIKIAEYFGVTTDYLLTGRINITTDKPFSIPDVKTVITVDTEKETNEKIREGWVLLSSGVVHNDGELCLVYSLGNVEAISDEILHPKTEKQKALDKYVYRAARSKENSEGGIVEIPESTLERLEAAEPTDEI